MKKIILIIGAAALACTACEKELDTYHGSSGIYFDTKEMYLDTIKVHWGLKNSDITEQELELKVCLFGNTKEYDRTFNVQVTTESGDEYAAAEGVDYRPLPAEYVIPAGQAETYIRLELLRSEGLLETPKRFVIRLVENHELAFLYSREAKLTSDDGTVTTHYLDYQRVIYMDERFPMPSWWSYLGNSVFGTWSMKKSALICDVMDIDRELWVNDLVSGLSEGYLRFCGKYMHRWLQENPQTDEDGSPMTMGTASRN